MTSRQSEQNLGLASGFVAMQGKGIVSMQGKGIVSHILQRWKTCPNVFAAHAIFIYGSLIQASEVSVNKFLQDRGQGIKRGVAPFRVIITNF